jgi:NAD(P)-dependent dehydrogenase (short-subunit alcohol dehydrogenase family)
MILNNKRVVVTGANGALGRAVATTAEAQGAEVIKLDMIFPGDSIDANCHTVNLSDTAATKALFEKLGKVDALLNIAGGFAMGETAYSENDEQWNAMFAINVNTLRNTIKAAVPSMLERKRGAIVNIGAYGALSGGGSLSAYCASKSTVMRLTESLSEELKTNGINVNAVLPTVIDTPANRASMPDADPANWVSPEKLASVICFLASDDASAIHGALLPVKGLS